MRGRVSLLMPNVGTSIPNTGRISTSTPGAGLRPSLLSGYSNNNPTTPKVKSPPRNGGVKMMTGDYHGLNANAHLKK